jgi:DNA polymerase-3 subunit delta'
MALKDLKQQHVVELLQRSLERGRLGHAYLFSGAVMEELELAALNLAKVLNCHSPRRSPETGHALDGCDKCLSCRKIDDHTHSDVQWIRPESKIRTISIDQIREMMQTIHLKATEGEYKVGIIVAADRMMVQAANAFLKTLEEPPPKSVFVLCTIEPQRLLETILSRCLRLTFSGTTLPAPRAEEEGILGEFYAGLAAAKGGLIERYRLLGMLLNHLVGVKEEVQAALQAKSPLERYEDVDPDLREKWEAELSAAIEAEYRGRRATLLRLLEWGLRDVWLQTLKSSPELLAYPNLNQHTGQIAQRLSSEQALDNLRGFERLQKLLHTNVQEALAMEVGLLGLKL